MSLVAYEWGSSGEESENDSEDDNNLEKQDVALKIGDRESVSTTPGEVSSEQESSGSAEIIPGLGGVSTSKGTLISKNLKEDFAIPNFLEKGLQRVEDYSEPLPLPSSFLSTDVEPEEEILEVEDAPFEPSVLLAQSRKQRVSVSSQNKEKSKSIGTLFSSLHAPWEVDKDTASSSKKQKSKGAVKISIPAAPEVDSDEEQDDDKPATKRLKPSETGSGLSSLLPKPMHSISFSKTENPNKPFAKQIQRPLIPHTLTKKKTEPKQNKKEKEEEDDDESVSFFSFVEKPTHVETEEQAAATIGGTSTLVSDYSAVDSSMVTTSFGPSTVAASTTTAYTGDVVRGVGATYNYPDIAEKQGEADFSEYPGNTQPSSSSYVDFDTASSHDSDSLDMEQILKLQGRRGQREEVNFVDVNCDEHLAPSNEWLKQVSEEKAQFSAKKKGGHMPSSQQRRKHQITYLAFQAKERELELRNQWASSRSAQRHAASKYGF